MERKIWGWSSKRGQWKKQLRRKWKRDKTKIGSQKKGREERWWFFCVSFQTTLHLGLWPPPGFSCCSGDSLSVYWRGRRLSVYKKRGSRGRGKKADKLLNEEANYPAHHTSSCQWAAIAQAPWGKVGLRTLKSTAIWPFQKDNQHRLPLATSHGQHPEWNLSKSETAMTVPLAHRITKAEETSKHSCLGVTSVSYLYQWRGLFGAFCWLLYQQPAQKPKATDIRLSPEAEDGAGWKIFCVCQRPVHGRQFGTQVT